MSENLSLAQLERLVAQRKARIESLQARRKKVLAQLEEIDRRIAMIEGRVRSGAPPQKTKKNVGKAGAGTKRSKKRRRIKGQPSLSSVIKQVLEQHKEGLRLRDLEAAVLATGYKTNSKNFRNVVYQNVYAMDEVKHDKETGLYRLG